MSDPQDAQEAYADTADSKAGLPTPDQGLPSGWQYKTVTIGHRRFWYASPKVQLFMVAMVCFLCPGMYNALGGLGGGGQLNSRVQDNASTALYSVFAVVAFFAGTVANKLGVRTTLAFGGIGYCLYAASFLCYNHTQNEPFVIFAGAFLGLCAGLLWTAQGAIMMSYPPENSKGRYISWFWIIFNMGGVVGALIPLGQNINRTENGSVEDGTYIGFIVLMALGAVLALLLCNADSVIRDDGSKVILMKNPTWQSEFIGLWECLYLQPWVVALFPMFFASNIFYTYQQNAVNGPHFNLRTRCLNNLLYWAAQIFGAIFTGYALDFHKFRRTIRARASFFTLFALTMIIWGGGYAWQKNAADRATTLTDEYVANAQDWSNPAYIGPMFLYIFYGFYDAVWQTSIYWYMGALSNSGRKTANMAGFYKGIQSAGAAIFWRLNGVGVSYNALFGATWGVCATSLLIAAPIIWSKIKDTTDIEEDLKFSDENIEEVLPKAMIEEKRAQGGV
ncbi:N-acetylglucosamine transmembrane transporter [Microdochium nivale]|nr:N-acetylglucosamine transmembrane transporter [Microdochium nivale]